MTQDIIIIPDVHGRDFWRHAVELYPFNDTIFLGDYLDPYHREGISTATALRNFENIIDHVSSHSNCHLLIGNHDLHYINNSELGCRKDYINAPLITSLFLDNHRLFNVIATRRINGKNIIFSHAPVLTKWTETTGHSNDIFKLETDINNLFSDYDSLISSLDNDLNIVSEYRGGESPVGSPLWADVREVTSENLIPTADLSIFAHTQLDTPVMGLNFACLDCRQAFRLTPLLELFPI